MRKKSLLFLLFFLVTGLLFSQTSIVAFSGYGYYSMSDLKSLQGEFKNEFPVDAKITSAFPAFWYFEGGAIQRFNEKYFAGALIGSGSTGGRVHYKDYSGEIGADQTLRYYSLAIPIGLILNPNSKFSVFKFDLRPGATFTNLSLRFYSTIGNQSSNQIVELNSLNIVLQPGFSFLKRFGNFGVEIQASYNLTLVAGKLYVKDSQNYLLNAANKEVKADWSGFRISSGFSFFLN
jgi:hypothetical protein